MIELKQNKIWTDSLSNALGLSNPWDELEKPLRKFICFAGGGGPGGDGDGDADDTDMDIGPSAPAGPTGPGGTSDGDFGGEAEGFGAAFGGLGAVSGPAGEGFGGFGGPAGADPTNPYQQNMNFNKNVQAARLALQALTPKEVVVPHTPVPYVPAPPPLPVSWARGQLAPLPPAVYVATNPNPPPAVIGPYGPQNAPVDFAPVSRNDIATRTETGRSINPGLTTFGYNTGKGRGVFGGYTSSDPDTAAADVAAGLGTSDVGSFDIGGLFNGLATTALGVLGGPVVSGALALGNAAQGRSGTGTFGALANAVQGNEAALTGSAPSGSAPSGSAPSGSSPSGSAFGNENDGPLFEILGIPGLKRGGIVGMASGGDLKDVLGFMVPPYGLGRAMKEDGIEGLLSFFSPAFALSGGQLPAGLDNLIGGSSEAQAPAPAAVRSAEVPVEASPPPSIGELEEMQNIAVMQQVLAGQPVEAQMGGLVSAFAMGGVPSPYFEGRVMGAGDGMSDSIPFSIEGQQPAILSRDEYVLPADIVSMMGNGSSDAGAGKIDSFINDFRVQKYGRGEQPPETSRGLSSIG